jgi:hypothetical protein
LKKISIGLRAVFDRRRLFGGAGTSCAVVAAVGRQPAGVASGFGLRRHHDRAFCSDAVAASVAVAAVALAPAPDTITGGTADDVGEGVGASAFPAASAA